MQDINDMKTNAQSMENRLRGDMQTLRSDMRTQQGEMPSMGMNLQASMKGIMAAPRGGTTEPRSANCVRSAMETGKVGTTSDATTIIGETETCRVRHEGMTEERK